MPPEGRATPPALLPRPEAVAYLANLLTVLGILLGAYVILRRERHERRGRVPMGPTGPITGWNG